MKINKSIVKFNMGAYTAHKYTSIDEVPYWSIYSLPNDDIENEIGHQWRSDRAITLTELKEYLQRYNGKRKLMAYPRKSPNRRKTYQVLINGNIAKIFDKWHNESPIAVFEYKYDEWNMIFGIFGKHNIQYYKRLINIEICYNNLH